MSNGKVLIVDCQYRTIKNHIDEIFDFLGLDVEGKSVLVKPNLLGNAEPEQCMDTHPALIKACIECCEKRGASKVQVGDNMGMACYGSVGREFEGCGFEPVIADRFVNLGTNLVKRHLDCVDTDVYVPKALFEADVVISLPKLKTHRTVGLTGAVKNQFGYIPGAQKPKLHCLGHTQEGFGRVLAEIMNLRKPDAFIMDAILILFGGKHPDKSMKYVGKLIASTDPVAVDAVMCDLMGVDRHYIGPDAAAEEMGLGTTDYTANQTVEPIVNIVLPPILREGKPTNFVDDVSLATEATRRYPVIDKEKCVKCLKCAAQCPLGLIKMDDGFPAMDPADGDKCASCFACMEICPERALYIYKKADFEAMQK